MFNDIAKKLTGIEVDLIRTNLNIRDDGANGPIASATKYSENQQEEQKGRFKLGGKTEEGQDKKKKGDCNC